MNRETLRDEVLATVLYFDVFGHPLLTGEVERLVAPGRTAEILDACALLEAEGLLGSAQRYHDVGLDRPVALDA